MTFLKRKKKLKKFDGGPWHGTARPVRHVGRARPRAAFRGSAARHGTARHCAGTARPGTSTAPARTGTARGRHGTARAQL